MYAGTREAHNYKLIKARNRVRAGQSQMTMALLKWLCSAVWLICMTSLLHLVLSCGESFVHATKYNIASVRA